MNASSTMTSMKTTFIYAQNPGVIFIKTSYHQQVISFSEPWKITTFWYLIPFERRTSRRTLEASSVQKKSTLDSDRLIKDASVEVDDLVSVSILKDCVNQIFQDIRHLQFNRMRRNVEFALQSQHEPFSDFGIQPRKDFNDWENESRRRLQGFVSLIVDSCDVDEHWGN